MCMKTFDDIRVGDSIYDLDGVSLIIYKVEDIWPDDGGGATFLFGKEWLRSVSASPHHMKRPTINIGYHNTIYADPDVAIKAMNDMISTLHRGIRGIEEDINTYNQ